MVLVCAILTAYYFIYSPEIMTCTLHPYLAFLYYCACIIIDIDSHMGKQILLIKYVDAILSVFLAVYVGEIPIFDM